MTRKLKTLGVALFAVLALAAVSASAASAEGQYTSSSYPATGFGTSEVGNDVFTTEGGTVECKSEFHATLEKASNDLTVTPTYSNCRAFGFVEASVTGCKFTFTTPKGSGDNWTADVHVVSPCTIVASTCHVTVPNQGPLSHVGITNDTAAGDVTVKATVSGITYEVIKDGFLCPFNGAGHKTGGTYNQKNYVTFDAVSPASASISVS